MKPPATPAARAWTAGLSCLSLVALVAATFAGPFLMAWISLGQRDHIPFPAPAFLYFVPAIVSVGLGVWTWRGQKAPVLASLVAVLGGAFGIAFGVMFAVFGLVILFLEQR